MSPPLAGFPRARPRPRPPTPRPRAPDAPPSFSFFSMAVHACLSTGRRRGRGEGRRRPQLCRRRSAGSDRVSGVEGGGAKRVWRIHRHEPRGRGRGTPGGGSRGRLYGARRRVRSPAAATPCLRRRRSAGSTEYRALRSAAQSGSGAPQGHPPCHRPCRRPCHPLPPCLRRGRRWERPPCWASMLSVAVDGHVERQFMFERPPGFKQKIAGALSQPIRPPGTRGRRRGALGGPF